MLGLGIIRPFYVIFIFFSNGRTNTQCNSRLVTLPLIILTKIIKLTQVLFSLFVECCSDLKECDITMCFHGFKKKKIDIGKVFILFNFVFLPLLAF